MKEGVLFSSFIPYRRRLATGDTDQPLQRGPFQDRMSEKTHDRGTLKNNKQ